MRLLICAVLLATQASAQQWTELQPAGDIPVPRGNPAAIHDPVGHRLIVFGGRVPGGEINDVWSLDLGALRWDNIAPTSGPAPTPRWTHNAVYDPVGHRMLIWSGRRAGTFYNDVWALDLTEHTWTELVADVPVPNVRYGTASVFDPLAGELVSFAGFTDVGRFDDTWRFDPVAAQWTDRTRADTPGLRCLHSASYDSRAHRMLVYGGQRGNGRLSDLWALDLHSDVWRELTPASSPAGRSFAASVYAERGDRFVIYGGDTGGDKSAETWVFDLAEGTWSQVQDAGAAPPARSGAAAVFVESQNRALYFAGEGTVGFYNDLWVLDNLVDGETAVQHTTWARAKVGVLE